MDDLPGWRSWSLAGILLAMAAGLGCTATSLSAPSPAHDANASPDINASPDVALEIGNGVIIEYVPCPRALD